MGQLGQTELEVIWSICRCQLERHNNVLSNEEENGKVLVYDIDIINNLAKRFSIKVEDHMLASET